MVEVTVFAFESLEGFEGLKAWRIREDEDAEEMKSGRQLLVFLFVTICFLSYVLYLKLLALFYRYTLLDLAHKLNLS